MNANTANDYAWHYTTGDNARKILDSGSIKGSHAFLPKGEHPIVWFSTHPIWEPTARKTWRRPDGSTVLLTFAGTVGLGGGGVRFGILKDRLLPWLRLKAAANISRPMALGLKRVAKRRLDVFFES